MKTHRPVLYFDFDRSLSSIDTVLYCEYSTSIYLRYECFLALTERTRPNAAGAQKRHTLHVILLSESLLTYAPSLHRDIKTSNILLTAGGVAKIADMGLAKMVVGVDQGSVERINDMAGTFAYISPEVLVGSSSITPKVRRGLRVLLLLIYSLGLCIYRTRRSAWKLGVL